MGMVARMVMITDILMHTAMIIKMTIITNINNRDLSRGG